MNAETLRHEIIAPLADVKRSLNGIERAIDRLSSNGHHVVRAKNPKVYWEISVPKHPMLVKLEAYLLEKHPGLICFTSGYREGDPGIHGILPLRAFDLRSRYFHNASVVEQQINHDWQYNDKQSHPVCLYHRTVSCLKCGHKFEVDPDHGVFASTFCPKCKAGPEHLKDWGQHFHNQTCDQTKRIT